MVIVAKLLDQSWQTYLAVAGLLVFLYAIRYWLFEPVDSYGGECAAVSPAAFASRLVCAYYTFDAIFLAIRGEWWIAGTMLVVALVFAVLAWRLPQMSLALAIFALIWFCATSALLLGKVASAFGDYTAYLILAGCVLSTLYFRAAIALRPR